MSGSGHAGRHGEVTDLEPSVPDRTSHSCRIRCSRVSMGIRLYNGETCVVGNRVEGQTTPRRRPQLIPTSITSHSSAPADDRGALSVQETKGPIPHESVNHQNRDARP